jgi:hypothetical protein
MEGSNEVSFLWILSLKSMHFHFVPYFPGQGRVLGRAVVYIQNAMHLGSARLIQREAAVLKELDLPLDLDCCDQISETPDANSAIVLSLNNEYRIAIRHCLVGLGPESANERFSTHRHFRELRNKNSLMRRSIQTK